MSNRITRVNKTNPIAHALSKKIMAAGDSITLASYMKSASQVSPVQQINRWPDMVANALGAQFDQALSGDGLAVCNSYLPIGSLNHTIDVGAYGGQIIISTNDSNDYWWDSDTATWKAIGGTTFASLNKTTEWSAMIADLDTNIVILSITGVNDYGEWSSRQALAKGAFGSPKMFYQRLSRMVVELLNAGKTPFIVTGLTAYDLTFHGKISEYDQSGTYAAMARRVAVEKNVVWADCAARLAMEAALGRPDFNARNANYKPDQYTAGEWEAIVNATVDPETGAFYLYPFTDAYRDSNGVVMIDETFDKYHNGEVGTADTLRTSYFANKHLNYWGQKVVADEILNIMEEYGLAYSDFDFSTGGAAASGGSGVDSFARGVVVQSDFDNLN